MKNIFDNVYLLGCDQGLKSRRLTEEKENNYVVEIEGCGEVYQIEFVPSLNYALFIEGEDIYKKN